MAKKESIPFTPPTESDLMLMQPNNVTFGQYQLTEIQENILTLITEAIQAHVTKNVLLPRDLFHQPYVEILCDEAGGRNNKKHVIEEALKMTSQRFSFKWLHPHMQKEIETAGTIITTVHDIKKSNKITINFNMWAIPFLMYYGVGVGGTKFNKNLALSVRGNYTKRIYKFICSQRDRREYYYNIKQFLKDMELPEKTTNTTLKDQVLERSKVRLNEKKSDVRFDYELICKHPISGRKPKNDTIVFKIIVENPLTTKEPTVHTEDAMYLFKWLERATNGYHSSEPREMVDKLHEMGNLLDVVKRCKYYDDQIAIGKITSPKAYNSLLKMLREEYKLKTPKK